MKFVRTKPERVPHDPPVRALPVGKVDPTKCPFKGCKFRDADPRRVRTHVIRSHQING